MEARHWHAAALERERVANRIRQVQDDPAISASQQRDDTGRVQDHLLVGMGAPADGTADRRGVPAAVSLVPGEGLDRAWFALAALDDLWAWRAARRCRLVDGCVGSR